MYDTGVPPAAGGATVHTGATYDALSRDAAVVSTGDEGIVDTGEHYMADVSAGVVGWMPADYYGKVELMPNATGVAAMGISDDEDTDGTLVSRGWEVLETNNGTFSKVAGNPAEMVAETSGSDYSNLRFTPTNTPARGVIMLKVKRVTASNKHSIRIYLSNATKFNYLTLAGDLTLGNGKDVGWLSGGYWPIGRRMLEIDAATVWLRIDYDLRVTVNPPGNNSDRVVRCQLVGDTSQFSDTTVDLARNLAGYERLDIYTNYDAGPGRLDLYELFWWEYL
jgi:hypothetical protein